MFKRTKKQQPQANEPVQESKVEIGVRIIPS